MASERRAETSRLEGFSDAVFAFALTLLVVSLEVPSSYDALVHTLRSFVAFAPSFAALIWIWYLHREFFRRYGIGDETLNTPAGVLRCMISRCRGRTS